jgi:hypothetical protein
VLWSESGVDKHGEAKELGLLFVAFMACNMQKTDLRNTRAAACQFYDCDFIGALWSKQSCFGWPDRTLSCSFDKVVLDASALEFLEAQGVKFAGIDPEEAIRYYDVSQNCIFDRENSTDLKELRARYPV